MFFDGIDEIYYADQNLSGDDNVQNMEGLLQKSDISVLQRNIKKFI